jgi:hypothetical protein
MWEYFEPDLRLRLSELEAGASTGDRVRAALVELLPAGRAGLDAPAPPVRARGVGPGRRG